MVARKQEQKTRTKNVNTFFKMTSANTYEWNSVLSAKWASSGMLLGDCK